MSATPSRLGLGLVLGVGLALFGCEKEDATTMGPATESDDDPSTDGVTETTTDSHATTMVTADGDTTISTSTSTTSTTSAPNTTDDTYYSDAVSYAGPDESEWIRSGTTK